MKVEQIIERANEIGVQIKKILEISPDEIKLDVRARWKCKFGCEYYGRASCPPNVPEFDECCKFIKSYKRCLLIIFKFENYIEDKRKAQKLMLYLERELISTYPFAFTLFPGGCDVCEVCDGKNCRTNARPAVSAMCIDVSSLGINWAEGYSVGILLIE